MNHLTSFKKKVLICELVCIVFFIVTGVVVFAMVEKPEKKVDAPKSTPEVVVDKKTSDDSQKWVPVVVLDDGTEKRVVSLSDFFKLARESSAISLEKPDAASANQLADLVKLKQQIDAGNKQIELLEKMVKQMDKKEKDEKKSDSWWREGAKKGIKFYKDALISSGKYLAEKLVHFTVAGILLVGTSYVIFRVVVPPVYCNAGFPEIFSVFSNFPVFGHKIPKTLYGADGFCSGYYTSEESNASSESNLQFLKSIQEASKSSSPSPSSPSLELNPACNWEEIKKAGGIIPLECIKKPA